MIAGELVPRVAEADEIKAELDDLDEVVQSTDKDPGVDLIGKVGPNRAVRSGNESPND